MTNRDEDKDGRKWNLFSIKDSNSWKKFFHLLKTVITPRFLYEIIIPQDILNIVKDIKFPDAKSSDDKENIDENVIRFVLACSVFNGVLVGMPGSLGWGVLVAQAVEVLMAVQIAKMVGLLDFSILSFKKIIKFFTASALTALAVGLLFKASINSVFNVFSNILPPGAPASAASAIVTTLFYGLFLYLCFGEIKRYGELGNKDSKISISMLPRLMKDTGRYTFAISKSLFKLLFTDTPRLLGEIKKNVQDTLNGALNVKSRIKGEIFLVGCLAYLLDNQHQRLEGPFANLWLQAWRDAFPTKLDARSSIEEIAAHASSYNQEELERVINNNINPKFFELLESTHENADGDSWSSELMETQNNPVSDALFFNSETGRAYEINYKFSENANYIENHIQLHPDVPVIATADVAEKINSPLVFGGNFKYDEVAGISEQNFEQILEQKHTLYLETGAVGSGAITLAFHMFPFLIAFYKEQITRAQLGKALKKFIPEITGRTINRVAMLSLLGPVYATFLIASFVGKATLYGFEEKESNSETDEKPQGEKTAQDTDVEKTSNFKKKFSRRDLITLSFLNDIN